MGGNKDVGSGSEDEDDDDKKKDKSGSGEESGEEWDLLGHVLCDTSTLVYSCIYKYTCTLCICEVSDSCSVLHCCPLLGINPFFPQMVK